jgi:hypothetical protein
MKTAEITDLAFQGERHTRRRSWLFVGLLIVLTILTILGFSPRYYWPLLRGQPLVPLLQHWGIAFHSILNLAWLAFFVLQAWLVCRGRTDLHIRLGPWLAAYGVLLVVLDYWVGMVIEARRVALGETVDRVLPLTFAIVRDLVMFAGFLVAGVIYRTKPAVHRALMFLATYSLVVVGLGRFLGMLAPYAHMSILIAIFFAPILVAAVYDWRKRGRPPYLYAVGFVVYLLFRSPAQAIWFPMLREHWPPIGRALLQPFL